ncbi:hypothetical protein CAM18_20655 [Salmonella enterica]|nr:hypothetical protein [Salmonella enterica]ECJ3906504.1 hypothetical protein [Salmonella enterica subsp. enterica serovar Poona]ECS8313771.1 hypothetical protein [Salmonella enterica subsp. enterica serovar Panama]EBK6349338.1 hypothetical protein [Salmonella enterica]EBR5240146.1 hypothetical protein [Salmonella enterica]
MQTSRVNGLTSGVFAFLEPASCLNQKGSDTRRDNITFPVADYYLHFPVFIAETPGAGKNLLFPRSRGWATEQREGVSPPATPFLSSPGISVYPTIPENSPSGITEHKPA